ncbi:replication initiation protein [Romboutsia sp.]|uniref:replication initiation protein n=1 Tax=Romboutsia sp. TaxID=1965302 RepID=UPI003F2A4573
MDKQEILMQPNSLIRGKYDFTHIENKLFYKMLYNAQKQSTYSKVYTTTIHKDELKSVIKNNTDRTEDSINTILNNFITTILEFDYVDENNHPRTFSSGLISSSNFNHVTQCYEIDIHETLYKHITDFIQMQKKGNGYTAINLAKLFEFKGLYTQRLYTIIRAWTKYNKEVEVKINLQQLREMLKMNPEIYPEYKVFKQKVLKRAIAEIEKTGNMKIEWGTDIRKNRRVDTIVLLVTDYEPRKYFTNEESEEITEIVDIVEANLELNEKKLEQEDGPQFEPKFKIENSNVNLELEDKDTSYKKLDLTVFTKGTLRSFKRYFSKYNWNIKGMEDAFEDAVSIVFETDDVELISSEQMNYFRGTLLNKICDCCKVEIERIDSVIEDEKYSNVSILDLPELYKEKDMIQEQVNVIQQDILDKQ